MYAFVLQMTKMTDVFISSVDKTGTILTRGERRQRTKHSSKISGALKSDLMRDLFDLIFAFQ